MMQAVKPKTRTPQPDPRGIGKAGNTSQIYNTPFFRPATHLKANNIWLRTMTRIVRHLRDDLARIHGRETMPTTWMIKCLLASMSHPDLNPNELRQFDMSDEQWDKNLLRILQRLHEYSASPEHVRKSFFELDGFTPLFPNQELFGPQHANRFAELALSYLNSSAARAG